VTGILGGTFDPPHNGHVALAQAALRELPIDRLIVLVAVQPGHRGVVADPQSRLRLAQAAFGGLPVDVVLDDHAFTADAVRDGRFGDALFIVGADEGAAFPTWKDPEEVLRWVRLAVGTRSGYTPPDLAGYGDRVVSFELDSPYISGAAIRRRIAFGQPVEKLVPPAVAETIEELGLYRGYTDSAAQKDSKSH
jgi:nicotinate-nucleotide adenylyltransferase